MRLTQFTVHIVAACSLALILGCQEAPSTTTSDGGRSREAADAEPFLPWKEGNTWTYRVTEQGVASMKVVTIFAEEYVGGEGPHRDKTAFKVVTTRGGGGETVSWRAVVNNGVVRYREQLLRAGSGELDLEEHWDPYKPYFDGTNDHTAPGASWLAEYLETSLPTDGAMEVRTVRERWLVDSPDEEVTVPAGTFRALVVQKAGGGELKTYWYVRGVGKVKETGGQTEELVSFEVAP
jgi:hypothetical protein